MILLVSVIMPNLNKGACVRDAIKSVLTSSYQNFELIIVDNGSSDESPRIIREYSKQDSRIIYLHEPRKGQSRAKNTGIAHSKGDLIAFIDSDDVYRKDKLSKQVRIFEEEPDTYACYTDGWIINGSGIATGQIYNLDLMPLSESGHEGNIFRSLLRYNFIIGGSVMLRKECTIDEMFDPKFSIGEDWDLWIRLARRYPFRYIPEPLYGYRIYQGNRTGPLVWPRNRAALLLIYEKWIRSFEGLDNADRKFLVRRLLKEYQEMSNQWGIVRLALSNRIALGLILEALVKRVNIGRRLVLKVAESDNLG